MFKRLLLILALGAALVGCTPAGGSSPAATVEPAASESMPSESMPMESASPSAS